MSKTTDIHPTLIPNDETGYIRRSIIVLRGKQVLLDFQLARLYGVETRVLNQSVRRNINRFPEDFMFKLSPQELAWMRSQIVTSYAQGSVDEDNRDSSKKVPVRSRKKWYLMGGGFTWDECPEVIHVEQILGNYANYAHEQ